MAAIPLHAASDALKLAQLMATANTLMTLYPDVHNTESTNPKFIRAATTIVAGSASPPCGTSYEFMERLTSGARATALANFYDSVLAGPFSEACNGEFTDIGVWLGPGDYQQGHEKDVLAALGLQAWTREKITTRTFEVPAECRDGFSTTYQNLKNAYCFCVHPGGDATACFLLGEMEQQWCGLVSIAIVSG